MYYSSSRDHEETDLRAEIGRKIETQRAQTPAITSPIGCSTAIAPNTAQPHQSGTPIREQGNNTATAELESTGKPGLKQIHKKQQNQVRFELEPRTSERLETTNRMGKLGGVEYF